jgi:hypothetical protein
MKKAELLAMMPFAQTTGVELASAKKSEVVGRLARARSRPGRRRCTSGARPSSSGPSCATTLTAWSPR